MTQLLPPLAQLIPNPSFETGTTGWSTSGNGALSFSWARSQAWSWVGSWSYAMTLTGGTGSGAGVNTNLFLTNAIAATPGQAYTATLRASVTDARLSTWITLTFYDASMTILSSLSEAVVSGVVGDLQQHVVTAEAPATTAFVGLTFFVFPTVTGATGICYVDGVNLVPWSVPTAYIDGDMPNCAWTGTPHNSPSTRAAVFSQGPLGAGGVILLDAALYLTDRLNTGVGDPAHLVSGVNEGKIVADLNAPITQLCEVNILEPAGLRPYLDCLAPVLTLTWPDGRIVSGQVGNFVIVPPEEEHRPTYSLAKIEARDFTWLLAASGPLDTYNVAAGTDPVAAVIAILAAQGFTRWLLAPSGLTLPTAKSYKPGTSWLSIINDLLAAIAWFPLWATRTGELTSHLRWDMSAVHPVKTFITGLGGEVTGMVDALPSPDDIVNTVVVIGGDPTNAAIVATAENDDPTSPSSLVSLNGLRLMKPPYEDNTIVDAATAKTMAQSLLQEDEGMSTVLTVDAVPDPLRSLNEVYALDLSRDDGTVVASGLWRNIGYTIYFQPSQGPMEYKLAQIAPFRRVY